MKRTDSNNNPWRAAGWMTAISADLIGCMVAGYFLGVFISRNTGGHRGWIAAGVIFGLFAGILSVVLLIRRFMGDSRDE